MWPKSYNIWNVKSQFLENVHGWCIFDIWEYIKRMNSRTVTDKIMGEDNKQNPCVSL